MDRLSPGPVLRLLIPVLVLASCGDEVERPLGPGARELGALAVDSDPRGGEIFLDGETTGLTTPDTIREVEAGSHELGIFLDTMGIQYSIAATATVEKDSTTSILGPLVTRCVTLQCVSLANAGRIQWAVRPVATLFFADGQGRGIFWPGTTANSYASGGGPVLAGIIGSGEAAGDTVALAPYDVEYHAGRPAPDFGQGLASGTPIRIPGWILPPSNLVLSGRSLPRGIAVEERIIPGADAGLRDVLFIEVTLRNISAEGIYRAIDPLPEQGIAYAELWPGFALDFDVGVSEDDLLTYVPELDLAVGYDSDFEEDGYDGGWDAKPGVVGLRMIEAPAGASRVVMNGWLRNLDWSAIPGQGEPQATGFPWLSATQSSPPNHPDPRIGYAPDELAGDLRMSVAAGPFDLPPGDSLRYVVAVLLAEPVPGSFTGGELSRAGDPTDPDRPILSTVDALVQKARAAAEAWESLK